MDIVFQNGFSSSIHVTEQDSTTITTTTTKKVYSNFPENFFNLIIITDINKKEIPCYHGNREHIFWLFVSYWAAEKIKYDFLSSV
jgi:hypothetical protein